MNDWAALFNSFPGAVKAIAEVVGEVGHSMQAWLHVVTVKGSQQSQLIDQHTQAKIKIIEASCDTNLTKIREEASDVKQRAKLNRLLIEERHQRNREAVTILALQNLGEEKMAELPNCEPSDDWFDLFGSYAERANSETMREHWARILEGEIRHPGTFSFCTLQLASMLDQTLASKIERVAKWAIQGTEIPHIVHITKTALYDDVMDLDSVGFLTVSESLDYITLEPGGCFDLNLIKSKVRIVNNGESIKIWCLPVFLLTIAGRELLKIVQPDEEESLRFIIAEITKEQGMEALLL